ncbi:MAG: T9SS type A sorting domain-containing protein [Candidatus Eisenbacteria bacterium]|uniref:T9SS type A sorting domain-containing protein n=1 Tax=Eiseniibacteriota bacterium TaxID=2212470 RepID=A0A849STF0_UNCEI|nr:T9SS type A sorting domain-containing protein [Candidatus Eisenbacteria bacterium]
MKRRVLIGALVLLFVSRDAEAHPSGEVIANGGGRSSNASQVLRGTLGQATVGRSASSVHALSHGFWSFGGSRVVGLEPPDETLRLPHAIAIGPAFPSPSPGTVRFAVALPHAASVSLEVFDLAGRPVGALAPRAFAAGYQSLEWRAPLDHAGVYFARVRVEAVIVAQRRIVVVR